jgi:predicted dinucleotide-utilizing enzyme
VAVEMRKRVRLLAEGLEGDVVVGEGDAVEALQPFPSKLKMSSAVR